MAITIQIKETGKRKTENGAEKSHLMKVKQSFKVQ